jgi:hypothetical protein
VIVAVVATAASRCTANIGTVVVAVVPSTILLPWCWRLLVLLVISIVVVAAAAVVGIFLSCPRAAAAVGVATK